MDPIMVFLQEFGTVMYVVSVKRSFRVVKYVSHNVGNV